MPNFEGREEELTQIQQWLSRPLQKRISNTGGTPLPQELLEKSSECKQCKPCLIEITAAGGYGKSALAAKAYEQAEGFDRKRKFWVNFNQSDSFRSFAQWLLEQFEKSVVETLEDEKLETELINQLAEKRYLLVLDNLETLLEEQDEKLQWRDKGYQTFLDHWLSSLRLGAIIVISRERLPLPDNTLDRSRHCQLGGLSTKAGVKLLRSHGIKGDDSALEKVVQDADGHPLLLKLIAGLLASESSRDISTLNTNLLQIGGLHRGDREVSVAKLLMASLERLSPKLRTLLLRLSFYRLTFDQNAANKLLGEAVTEAELKELVKRSLLQAQGQQEKWTYQFQPLIRQCIIPVQSVELSEEERAKSHQRAIEYYHSVYKPSGWKTLEDVAEYLEIFYHYSELKQYFLAFAAFWNSDGEISCDKFLEVRGYNSIRVDLYKPLLEQWKPTDALEQLQFAQMLNRLGCAYRFLGKNRLATELHERALKIFR